MVNGIWIDGKSSEESENAKGLGQKFSEKVDFTVFTVKLTVFDRKFRILTVLTFSEFKNNARIVFLVQKYVRIVFFKKVLASKIFGQFLENSKFRKKIRKFGFYENNFRLRNFLYYILSDVFSDEEHDSGIIFDLRKS